MAAMRDTKRKGRLALEEETMSQLTPHDKGGLIKPQDYSRCFAAYYTIFCHGIARENVIPPLKYEPLTEAIKKVAIHQADGYSPLTPYIIPYFRANVLVKIEMVEPDKLPRHGTREQSDSTNSVAAAVPLPRNPTVKNRTPHIIPYFATGLQGKM